MRNSGFWGWAAWNAVGFPNTWFPTYWQTLQLQSSGWMCIRGLRKQKFLITKDTRTPTFYRLPRIHISGVPLWHTVRATYLHKIILPMIPCPASYIVNSWYSVQILNQLTISEDAILSNSDTESLFTSPNIWHAEDHLRAHDVSRSPTGPTWSNRTASPPPSSYTTENSTDKYKGLLWDPHYSLHQPTHLWQHSKRKPSTAARWNRNAGIDIWMIFNLPIWTFCP